MNSPQSVKGNPDCFDKCIFNLGKFNFSKSVIAVNILVNVVVLACLVTIFVTTLPLGLPWYQVTLPVILGTLPLIVLNVFTAILGYQPAFKGQKATINDVIKMA